jgi:hypothetical protein
MTGRREHTRWARETLVEVMVAFMDAGFDGKDAVKKGIRSGTADTWPPPFDDSCSVAHDLLQRGDVAGHAAARCGQRTATGSAKAASPAWRR